MLNAALMREMASHGYFVVAIDHNDQSCSLALGKPVRKEGGKEEEKRP